MSNPFVGEIRMFGGNFAPQGWAFCSGQLVPIAENDVLFALIGTTYGGDGQSTFALPDLRGRIPIHPGGAHTLAESGGSEEVTRTANQLAAHSHALQASTNAASSGATPADATGNSGVTNIYGAGAQGAVMSPSAIGAVGSSQPHNNMAPYQCVNFIISLFGIFPSQN